MNDAAFQKMIDDAKRIREAAVAKAQAEYNQRIEAIELVRKIPQQAENTALASYSGVGPPRIRPMTKVDLIRSTFPERNVQFTVREVQARLNELHPDHGISIEILYAVLNRFEKQTGEIVRLEKGGGRRASVYVVLGSDETTNRTKLAEMNRLELAEHILRQSHSPLTPAELIERMKAEGFSPSGSLAVAMNQLRHSMRRRPVVFQCLADDRWKALAKRKKP